MHEPDADLISLVVISNDRNAFGKLVLRYQSGIRQLLRRLTAGDNDLADDLAQETFIRAFHALKGFMGGAAFSSWLYRIAYNVFISDARTRRHHRIEPLENAEHVPAPERSDAGIGMVDLERAMGQLGADERAALTLSYMKGLAHGEIAKALDCPLGTVKTLILRAKEKIKKKMLVLEAKGVV